MSVLISPTKATTIFRLPAEFACAYSPGFDLHVSGMGDTPEDARAALVVNLYSLATELQLRASEVEQGKT